MSARHVALAGLAALVALGGVLLLIEVKSAGEKPPSAHVLEEAQVRHARTSGTGTRPGPAGEPGETSLPKAGPRLKQPGFTGGEPVPSSDPPAGDRPTEPAAEPELNPDLDAALLEANKAYDRKDFERAREIALKLLQTRAPGNVRMLRVVVSSACILGDADQAIRYAADLPAFDKQQMTGRCAQYGITLP